MVAVTDNTQPDWPWDGGKKPSEWMPSVVTDRIGNFTETPMEWTTKTYTWTSTLGDAVSTVMAWCDTATPQQRVYGHCCGCGLLVDHDECAVHQCPGWARIIPGRGIARMKKEAKQMSNRSNTEAGLFWVAALEHPTKEGADKGDEARVVLAPTPVVARHEPEARLKASRLVDAAAVEARTVVYVRPF